jgi:hypothetical protein
MGHVYRQLGCSGREFGHPMIVAFGVEMNGDWFAWSSARFLGLPAPERP